MTNSHEGDIFVDASTLTASNATLAEYVADLFPRMNDSSIQQAVALYSHLTDVSATTVPQQAAFVMGDSILVCQAFYVLNAFPDNSGWKVRGISMSLNPADTYVGRVCNSSWHTRQRASVPLRGVSISLP